MKKIDSPSDFTVRVACLVFSAQGLVQVGVKTDDGLTSA